MKFTTVTRINKEGMSLWCGLQPFQVLGCGCAVLWRNLSTLKKNNKQTNKKKEK